MAATPARYPPRVTHATVTLPWPERKGRVTRDAEHVWYVLGSFPFSGCLSAVRLHTAMRVYSALRLFEPETKRWRRENYTEDIDKCREKARLPRPDPTCKSMHPKHQSHV